MLHYPSVLDEFQTLSLLEQGKSIARYGDGELKLCRGASAKAQDYNFDISERLKQILQSDGKECVVGIPRIGHLSEVAAEKHGFWSQYQPQTQYYNYQTIYGSSFITRPDSVPAINTQSYFARVKALWNDRKVILVNGDNKRFDKNPTILDNAAGWTRWEVPAQNAWSEYEGILRWAKTVSKDVLFILCVGPTATVLAYDLCAAGYQALDLGHLGMFYARLFE